MILSAYGELTEKEQSLVDDYLEKYPEKKNEFDDIKKFQSFVSGNASDRMSDELLRESRSNIRHMLLKKSPSAQQFHLIEVIREFVRPKFVVTGLGALSLGILIGYCSFAVQDHNPVEIQSAFDSRAESAKTRIENVRFIDADAEDGTVEFEFNAVAPMKLKGKIDDPDVRKILTYAMLNGTNDGIRLSSIHTIARQMENTSTADSSVRAALITTLTTDKNPGVRREALRVLQQCSFGSDIRDAFLHVLLHDDNSGLRVAAINAIETARMEGNPIGRSTVDALNKQLSKEQNTYIRTRAANLVKEIYQ